MIQFAVVLIKPDALRDFLEEPILRDLRAETGMSIIFRKMWLVTRELTKLLYPAWVNRSEFSAMVNNITQGNSLFLIVAGGPDIYGSLIRAKGKMNKGGLRLKYRTFSVEELEAMGYEGNSLRNKAAENRLHTTDDFADTVYLCNLALSSNDLSVIEHIAPRLFQEIVKSRQLAFFCHRQVF